MKKILIAVSLLAFGWTAAFGESSVWKVEREGSVLYLGGTCHLLRPSDFPLPSEFQTAYEASEKLVFETDIGKLQSMEVQVALMAKGSYSDGSTVVDHLSPESYRLVDEYCQAQKLPLNLLKKLKPSMLVVTLSTMELMRLGAGPEGVDISFYQKALADGKAVAGLEPVEKQIDLIVGMGDGREDDLIRWWLEDMESIAENYEQMVTAWRTGDIALLEKLMVDDFQARSSQMYQEMIRDRNRDWEPQILDLLSTSPCELILVGAAHLVGPEGLIEALRAQGCSVDKL